MTGRILPSLDFSHNVHLKGVLQTTAWIAKLKEGKPTVLYYSRTYEIIRESKMIGEAPICVPFSGPASVCHAT